MQLTSENVHFVFTDCLFTEEEVKDLVEGQIPENAVLVEGLTIKVGFHKERLSKHKEDIKSLLSQISDKFVHNVGGGMSFLELPSRSDGTQWGEHPDAQELLLLGIGSKYMQYCAPQELWPMLPGGVPYVVINLDN